MTREGRETSVLYLNFIRRFQIESGKNSEYLMSGKEKLMIFQTTAVHKV